MKKTVTLLLVLVLALTAAYFGWTKWNTQTLVKEDDGIDHYHCGMHPWITSDKPGKCPICGMDLTPVYKKDANKNEGFVSIDPAMVQNIGVKTEVVSKRKLTHTIRTTGRVDYDETTQSVISTKFSGWIEKLYVNYVGKPVQQGQPLFEIYSPELVAAQQEYLQALHYNKTMKSANDSALSAGANNLVQSAQKKLQYWNLTPSQLKELEQTGMVKKTITVYADFSGVVVEKNIVDGMQIQAGAALLKLANVDNMWIYADVYENELSWVKTGEAATIELPGNAAIIKGSVSYIYPFIQDQTRTAKLRIAYTDNHQLLKKDMYVTVNIIPTTSISVLAVPEQSVIHSGNRDIVVLALGDGKFMSVEVKLGVLSDGYYEVKEGLSEGDAIVTSSQFLIDSESNLKAGTESMHENK